jgi:hypothetical protein
VAFGLIPHNFVDSTGDTMGGIGSAIALKSWKACKGKYEGTFLVQPDRGFNVYVLHTTILSSEFQSIRVFV